MTSPFCGSGRFARWQAIEVVGGHEPTYLECSLCVVETRSRCIPIYLTVLHCRDEAAGKIVHTCRK